MRVAIAGAGAVGLHVANELSRVGYEVLLIEQDRAVVERAVIESGVRWHVGDACEVSSLKEADLQEYDVLVAATGDDEDNLVVSLLAKQEFGMPRVIARVNHPKNEWMFTDNWGVDVRVSTPHLITAMVEEAVTVGKLVEILRFEGGLARLVEVTLAPDSPVCNISIQKAVIPRDATVVAIIRGAHLVVPRGETVFEDGDEVLALVTPDSEAEMRELLTGER
ncbi:MAG: TrkA family potassium uptake protein [Actinobacteria bacterium]|nr:TrkA family potassium uptake protein [Actinomycetota bacterium]